LVVGAWALKVARDAQGRRCNLYEAKLFAAVDVRGRELLWPVRGCSGGGWLLVMAAAKPRAEDDHRDLLDLDDFPDWDYRPDEDGAPFEYKASDWWRRKDGRLVALDYSTPADLTEEEIDELMRTAAGRIDGKESQPAGREPPDQQMKSDLGAGSAKVATRTPSRGWAPERERVSTPAVATSSRRRAGFVPL